MRIPRSPAVIEACQWFGLVGAPLAFAVEHVIGVGATFAGCNPARLDVDVHAYQLTIMAIAAVVAIAAEGAALLAFLATRECEYEDDPPPGRIHFLATAGLAAGPLFLAIILLNGLGAFVHAPCRQA